MLDLSAFQLPLQDPVLVFTVAMTLILVAPLVSRGLRLPGIVGLLVAGMIVGPNALNLLDQGETVRLLGTVGLLYVMFLAGLEIDLAQLRRSRNRSLVFGFLTFIVPQSVGTVVFLGLGFDWPAAILIASMFASHTLVSYPVVGRLGIARDDAVTTGVGGTVLTDTAALMVLAIVARSLGGEMTTGFWVGLFLLFGLYVAGVILLLPRLGRWAFRQMKEGGVPEFAFVLAAVFACAFLARAVGTEPIIGAFLAGLVLNRLIPGGSALMARIQFFGDSFLIPFFLLFIGMFVDIRALASGLDAWIIIGGMVGCTVVAKALAAWGAGTIFGYTRARKLLLFGLSVPQAAATLAVTLVGYDLGLFNEAVLNGAIVLIFVTCVLGPWVTELAGQEVARGRKLEADDLPTEERVLVPLANPATSERLVELALAMRGNSDEPVFPLNVTTSSDPARVREGEEMLGAALAHTAAAGIAATPLTRVDLEVATGIRRAAVESRATAIVAGWNGVRSPSQRIFGSVLDPLVAEATATLVIARLGHPLNTFRRVVVAAPPGFSRAEGGDAVISLVKRLASSLGREIEFLVPRDESDDLRARAVRLPPRTGIRLRRLATWFDVYQILRHEVRAEDLFVLLSLREGPPAWEAGLSFLPGNLSEWFPERSFLVCYPPRSTSVATTLAQGPIPPPAVHASLTPELR